MRCTEDALLQRSVDNGGVDEEIKVTLDQPRPRSRSPSPSLASASASAAATAVDKEDSDVGSHHRKHSPLQSQEEPPPEYLYIDLREIRKQVECPICLGIINKTRTVMECMHRFCRECIDKSMRMGNNECPACRTHCASRRSLKDDPRYDSFIQALFPDVVKYEAEELAFCEEDKARNKKIQASIAQILEVQSDAVGTKQSSRKGTRKRCSSDAPSRRSKRRRTGKTLADETDENEGLENTEWQTSSFSADHSKISNQYRHKIRRRIGTSGPPSPTKSSEKLEQKSSHPGIMWNMETRAWGRSGARSNIRNESNIRKDPPSPHLVKLAEPLHNLEDDVRDASEAPPGADNQPIAATETPGSHFRDGWPHLSAGADKSSLSECTTLFRDRLQSSEEKETHAGFEANCISHAVPDFGMPAEGNHVKRN